MFRLAGILLCVLSGRFVDATSFIKHQNEYDFIVVGGGTAGAALATRLSQRLSDRILLIEAGPSAPDELKINVPGMRGAAVGTIYDWNFTTVPQPHTLNRTWSQPRGKVLGGSSALNLLIWDRASKAEYDAWEELGNPGWNWHSMLHYMHRAENFMGVNTSTYGSRGVVQGGPVSSLISRLAPTHLTYLIPTLEKMGIRKNLESLDGDSLGVMYQPQIINATYYRSYSANAYIPRARRNLGIMTHTMASKVLFQTVDGKLDATGVIVNGTTYIRACKEIILSGGSLQSPGLLEASGVGQRNVLEKAGVRLLMELAGVGENLQDHVRITLNYELAKNYSGSDRTRFDPQYASQQLQLWRAGMLSIYDGSRSAISFQALSQIFEDSSEFVNLARASLTNTSSVVDRKKLEFLTTANKSHSVPEVEIIGSDGYTGVAGYPSNTSAEYGAQFYTLIAAVQHALSRGSVHINNNSTSAKPIIDPRYLSNPYDRAVAVHAAKHNRRIAETYPLSQAWTSEYAPSMNVQTDQQWMEYTLNNTATLYHPVGTCAMLPRADGGVVDSELRVYGTNNLRVVDASIMPMIISGHLQTAVYGIAEKAADLIVAQHQA